MNGYNFTDRVRQSLQLARLEASELRHDYVGTEHILLGILHENGGVAVEMLEALSIDGAQIRESIVQVVKPGRSASDMPELPYTSRAKKTLELAMMEARELNHSYVGTEHLLLGLIREEKGIAAQVLCSVAGMNAEMLRATIHRLLIDGESHPEINREAQPRTARVPRSMPPRVPSDVATPEWQQRQPAPQATLPLAVAVIALVIAVIALMVALRAAGSL